MYNFNYSYISSVYTLLSANSFNVDENYNMKKQRVLHLHIKEFNDQYDNQTSNIITTFRLYPRYIKNKFLYADSKNIKKVYEMQPRKLNKITIVLADSFGNPIHINFLDTDVSSKCNACICTPDVKNYSCPCNYILHPYNLYRQLYLFFVFGYYQVIHPSDTLVY